ncbi:unnamed protein product [Nesidiocoris tenuis]|uniref:Uncharacterized protein n=1 Tax=Nesidiocoris tenuis TaxID=355587 RepID=A0A6H5HUL0_9HEMI|nr:unnamed protein product [Nesidiocoris tenuis]CAB0020456.1 unnamed protein product [Nesidiocoris tenuis]
MKIGRGRDQEQRGLSVSKGRTTQPWWHASENTRSGRAAWQYCRELPIGLRDKCRELPSSLSDNGLKWSNLSSSWCRLGNFVHQHMSRHFRLPTLTPVLITKAKAVELCQELTRTHKELSHLKVWPDELPTQPSPYVIREPCRAGCLPVPLPRGHQSVLHYRIPVDRRAVHDLLGRQFYNPRHPDLHLALDPVHRPPPHASYLNGSTPASTGMAASDAVQYARFTFNKTVLWAKASFFLCLSFSLCSQNCTPYSRIPRKSPLYQVLSPSKSNPQPPRASLVTLAIQLIAFVLTVSTCASSSNLALSVSPRNLNSHTALMRTPSNCTMGGPVLAQVSPKENHNCLLPRNRQPDLPTQSYQQPHYLCGRLFKRGSAVLCHQQDQVVGLHGPRCGRYSASSAQRSLATNTLSSPLHRWKHLRADRVAAFSLSNPRVHHPAPTLGARCTGIDADAARAITLSRLTAAASTSKMGQLAFASLNLPSSTGPISPLPGLRPTILNTMALCWLMSKSSRTPANRHRGTEGDVYVRTPTRSSPNVGTCPTLFSTENPCAKIRLSSSSPRSQGRLCLPCSPCRSNTSLNHMVYRALASMPTTTGLPLSARNTRSSLPKCSRFATLIFLSFKSPPIEQLEFCVLSSLRNEISSWI